MWSMELDSETSAAASPLSEEKPLALWVKHPMEALCYGDGCLCTFRLRLWMLVCGTLSSSSIDIECFAFHASTVLEYM